MRRISRRRKRQQELVNVYRNNPDTDASEIQHENLPMNIHPASNTDQSDIGVTIELNNLYVAYIIPPNDNINENDEFERPDGQKLVVKLNHKTTDVQRVFLEDIDKQFS